MDLEHVEVARSSAQEHETARHEVTVRQASILFAEFGVPRSPRSVQGFCKDGHLDCVAVKGPNGDRYLINRESIERYATELKQIDEVAKIGAHIDSALLREPARESAQERAQPETPDDIPIAATEAPVSYTHLDVYKRQRLYSPSLSSSARTQFQSRTLMAFD